MKRILKKVSETLNNIVSFLLCPKEYLSNRLCSPINAVYVLVFLSLGIAFHRAYPFPYFYSFVGAFLFIGCVCLKAEYHYCKETEAVIRAMKGHANIESANHFINTVGNKSALFIVVPAIVVLVFGIGGCMMFSAVRLTPTFIWVMLLFSVVVYISIIGYLQYIFLAVYIFKLSREDEPHKKLEKESVEYTPADIGWIKQLTKLTHLYRSVFFTLGCVYIFSFGAFCYLPDFGANANSVSFFLLWGIIFLAIVLTFPMVSILEYRWIKQIVLQLKAAYIVDLETECMLLSETDAAALTNLVKSICVRQILNSKEYPLATMWNTVYAALLSAVNLLASLITIMGGVTPVINALRQTV